MAEPGRRTVSTSQLEARLARLETTLPEPVSGLYGPGSAVWEISRHACTFLGGGRAALLQVAHPQVAQAIVHHSRTRTDPYGRFQRTFRQVFPMVWGSRDQAFAAARAVHRVHLGIHGRFEEDVGRYHRGDRYDANDRSALLWVHATLWETSIAMHETFVGALSLDAKEGYYQETKRFAALFGLEEDELPGDWSEFLSYNRRRWESDALAVGSAGREIASYLFEPPDPLLAPAFTRLRLLTIGLLPEPVAHRFGLALDASERRRFERLVPRLSTWLPRLPRRLRYVPPYFAARRRVERRGGVDWLGRAVERLYLGGAA
ncbi:MAG TPA: oxygenase MpaB family protein [Thermoanaerobaculia bacterium]|nr:oxygenase MpaB family protein [Thermoanaerobaculia bacterium]